MSKEAVRLSADKISEKWGRRLKAAQKDITDGLDAVTEDPGVKAVAAKEKLKAKLIASIDDGTWEKRRLAVGLSEWRDKTKKKVIERLSGGVEAAMGKRKKFDSWLVSRLNGILPTIKGMSDMTISDSVERVRAMMEYMHAERYKGV